MQGLVDEALCLEGSGKAHKQSKQRQVSKVSMTEATRVGTWVVPKEDNMLERAQQEDDPHGLQKHGPDRTSKQNDPLGLFDQQARNGQTSRGCLRAPRHSRAHSLYTTNELRLYESLKSPRGSLCQHVRIGSGVRSPRGSSCTKAEQKPRTTAAQGPNKGATAVTEAQNDVPRHNHAS